MFSFFKSSILGGEFDRGTGGGFHQSGPSFADRKKKAKPATTYTDPQQTMSKAKTLLDSLGGLFNKTPQTPDIITQPAPTFVPNAHKRTTKARRISRRTGRGLSLRSR